jgi:phenylalanyl-tRNA synthetase beta chain
VGNRFSRTRGETPVVAYAWTGAGAVEHWSGGARDVDFFDAKGVAERVCHALRADGLRTEPHNEAWLVAGQSAALLHGTRHVGVLGRLAPEVADAHGLPGHDAVYVAEIDLDAVEEVAQHGEIRVEPLPRYPSVTRDVALLIDDTLPSETLRATITSAAPQTLVRVREFDRYQGKGVPEGKISLALRLTFRSPERTLTDAEVQSAMDAIVGALKSTHGAVQR